MAYLLEKEEVAYFMRRLYEKNLTTTSGGNLSMKINDNTILVSPSSLDKGRMNGGQIAEITLSGKNLTPELVPSIETNIHLAIYRKRPDVTAVVHAHPVIATAFTAMNKQINTNLVAEARSILGLPVMTKYAPMGSKELAAIISDAVSQGNVMLMENHGILTVGNSLLQAFDRIEVLESAAKMTLITELLHDKRELSEERIKEIDSAISYIR